MSCLGLDIGGANLKAADGRGWAQSVPFPLWRQPENLADALAALIVSSPSCEQFAVTMTGELCDCYATKADGVRHILSTVEHATTGRMVSVYLVDGRFVPVDQARNLTALAAASNWHALASFACRYVPNGTGLLIDVGSTTTDIVPLVGGRVASTSLGDLDRLAKGELVYTGVRRTPICAITQHLPWQGILCPVAAELFATSADAYLLLGELEEEPTAAWTADGKPFTVEHSRQRLARMFCADRAEIGDSDLDKVAQAIREIQMRQIAHAVDCVIERMPEIPTTFVTSGSGEFLIRTSLKTLQARRQIVSLTKELDREVSGCASAHALAVLASDSEKTGGS